MAVNLKGQIIDEQGNKTGGQINIATGQLIQPNMTSPITSNDLIGGNSTTVTKPATTPPYDVSGLETPLTKSQQDVQTGIEAAQKAQTELAGKSAYEFQQKNLYGLPEIQKTQNDLSTQLDMLKKEAASTRIQYEGALAANKGTLEPFVSGERDALLRQNAVKALTVSALYDATNNQLGAAQAKIDRAVNEKYGPIEADLKAKLANLDLITKSPRYTQDEKDQAAARELIIKQKEADIIAKKQNQNDIWNISVFASQNIQNFKATSQYPTAALAIQAIQNSKSKEEAQRIAVETGLTKPPSSQSDFEQAFLRTYNRLPTVQELLNYKKQQAEITPPKSEARDTNASQYLESQKGTDGYVSTISYQTALRRFIANGGTQSNFLASFPQQTYLRQQEIDKLPASLRTAQVAPQKTLSADQQSILNEAKATWDAAKQTYQATPELRQKIIDRAKQLGFDLSPYF